MFRVEGLGLGCTPAPQKRLGTRLVHIRVIWASYKRSCFRVRTHFGGTPWNPKPEALNPELPTALGWMFFKRGLSCYIENETETGITCKWSGQGSPKP